MPIQETWRSSWYSPLARANSRNSARDLVFRCRSYPRTNFGTLCVLIFYIRFNVCASASWTDIKKLSTHYVCTQRSLWSEWRDLNSRPYGPEPYALPNCATPRLIMTAFRNIHHLSFFCNRNEKRKRKIIDYFAYLHKTFANQYLMLYNISRDGAWCSGSTWASDSHCVGSIPIAPANANTLTCESVLFFLSTSVLARECGQEKRTITA